MEPRRVVFSGCRFATFENSGAVVENLINQLVPTDIVVHGACKGIDSIVDYYARRRNLQVESKKADWGKYGRAAGPVRNKEMLTPRPAFVVCVHPDITQSKGTLDMKNQAEKAGILVIYQQYLK